MKLKMAFMTLTASIPSRQANAVSMMNNCSQFARRGLDLELIVPRGQIKSSDILPKGNTIWEFYAVPEDFKITHLPRPFFCKYPGNVGYTMLAVSYAVLRGKSLVYSRHIELAYLAAIYGRISIFESHNYLKVNRHPILPHWIRMLRNPARRIAMVVTTHAGARAYEAMGVPQERMLVAPNGVDVKRFLLSGSRVALKNSFGLPKSKTIVGFCGHLYKGRGIEELLQCARLLDRIYFLIVGGEPDDIHRCSSLAQDLGLSNVRFTGFVPQSSVPSYLLASDILVMPYTRATFLHDYVSPMKMFEYLASGRPVVATDLPIFREVLHDGHNAVLVPPDSGQALASGIQWLLDHPESARKLGEQARRDAEQYSWENRVRRIVSWFREMFHVRYPN
jgi:glycosyltransferase involved in cell wall biosynthesis